jgi:hypothetical protein
MTMPNGSKYRISSMRRYIVVRDIGDATWHAIKRSDNLQTALMEWRSAGRRGQTVHVIDANAEGGPAVIR